MAKTHSMKFVSCCYFRHDVDFSIDFPGKDIGLLTMQMPKINNTITAATTLEA
jgi:hypothetical protein